MKNLNQFSDSELYSICKKWGREALTARRRFAGLLPEVYHREMESRGVPRKSWLERRGYTCIYEFAVRLAGMSRDQVNRVLQLDKRFSALPILHESLIHGDVSVNKLARIASVATLENQRELLNKAEKLSKAALEIYIKEYRVACGDLGEQRVPSAYMNMVRAGMRVVPDEQNTDMNLGSASQVAGQTVVSLFESDILINPALSVLTAGAGSVLTSKVGAVPTAKAGVVPGHRFGDTETKTHGLQLDTDVETELKELQAKGIDVSDFLRKCLAQRKLEIAREKEKMAEEANRDREDKFLIGKPASRYVPAKIKRIIRAQYGDVCSAAGCMKPAAHIHHQKPFASFGSHDPCHLRPLCKAHHELAHVGEVGLRGGGDGGMTECVRGGGEVGSKKEKWPARGGGGVEG